jgi:hypothetical protein
VREVRKLAERNATAPEHLQAFKILGAVVAPSQ